uniref:Multiple epidermal growth factor-like domains protein 11 n=1 Tax=Crassostrea virginica TaxID=6565 RepID=A0A8B8C6G1_CRAVI|nr:multiple epidermal growth factor-like domains protein 11 [Crassostrea virginica]
MRSSTSLFLSAPNMFIMSTLTLFLGFFSISFAYENIALNQPSYQQHPYPGFPAYYIEAGNAVDGQKSNLSWQGGQCAISENKQHKATWWVNLTRILSIHHITVYYRTGNTEWGPANGFTPRFLGFSLYISNTTEKSDGTLCFEDTNFNLSTIPAVFNQTCTVHGQYVIYYNERLEGVTYPDGYSTYAFNELCEVEVYGCSSPGFYGPNCSTPCPDPHCRYCHIETGTCQGCMPGYKGHKCEQVCPSGLYGDGCKEECGHCVGLSNCHHVTGLCLRGCQPGYKGYNCLQHCDNRRFGKDCIKECGSCLHLKQCHHITGICADGCNPGFHGLTCTNECEENYFGFGCKEMCNGTCNGCNKVTGVCDKGCKPGWKGIYCHEKCEAGYYGKECCSECGHCGQNGTCHHVNGKCLQDCKSGYQPPFCKEECTTGKYGLYCAEKCGHCLDPLDCFHETGICLHGCRPGFQGLLCQEVSTPMTISTAWQAGFFGVFGVLCTIVLLGVLFVALRKLRNGTSELYQPNKYAEGSQHDLMENSVEEEAYVNLSKISKH